MSAASGGNHHERGDPLAQLGGKMARRRKELDLSQPELVERMNATPFRPGVDRSSHISNIETGGGDKLPSVRSLAALAMALETNMDYLAGLSDDPKPASDLEDQVVVGVENAERRARLQEAAELLAGCSDDDFAALVWIIRRLVVGAPAGRRRRDEASAPGITEGARQFTDQTILANEERQDDRSQVHKRRPAR